ncbi:hypothetical protein F3K39_34535 [Streptomyces sp. LBUM 1479]|nr:hypothetical protein [Streptomyces sp. LBUM 1479]
MPASICPSSWEGQPRGDARGGSAVIPETTRIRAPRPRVAALGEYAIDAVHGFVPAEDPVDALPAYYEPWERLARNIAALIMTGRMRPAVESLPVLAALQRGAGTGHAAVVLSRERVRVGHRHTRGHASGAVGATAPRARRSPGPGADHLPRLHRAPQLAAHRRRRTAEHVEHRHPGDVSRRRRREVVLSGDGGRRTRRRSRAAPAREGPARGGGRGPRRSHRGAARYPRRRRQGHRRFPRRRALVRSLRLLPSHQAVPHGMVRAGAALRGRGPGTAGAGRRERRTELPHPGLRRRTRHTAPARDDGGIPDRHARIHARAAPSLPGGSRGRSLGP